MGMYTDLNCTAKIKPRFQNKIHKRIFQQIKWKKLFHKLGHEFCINRRCEDIPLMESKISLLDQFDGETLHIKCSTIDNTYLYDDFFDFLQEISDEITEYKTLYEENKERDYNTNSYVYSWYNYLTKQWENVVFKQSQSNNIK